MKPKLTTLLALAASGSLLSMTPQLFELEPTAMRGFTYGLPRKGRKARKALKAKRRVARASRIHNSLKAKGKR